MQQRMHVDFGSSGTDDNTVMTRDAHGRNFKESVMTQFPGGDTLYPSLLIHHCMSFGLDNARSSLVARLIIHCFQHASPRPFNQDASAFF